jgi:hypothetical protein
MECKYCHVMMEIGHSIRSDDDSVLFVYGRKQPSYTWGTLDIVKCWKCPKCGHSEYLDNDS